MADKDEEGTADEPTFTSRSTPSGADAADGDSLAAEGPTDRSDDVVVEPTGAELAASGADTAGRDDVADLERDRADTDALQPVAAGAIGRNAKAARDRRPAPRTKDAPTPARDRPDKVHRTGPVSFVKESVGELRKVVYPTGQQLLNYFVVVLVFVLFVIAYVSLLDLGLGWAIFRVFS